MGCGQSRYVAVVGWVWSDGVWPVQVYRNMLLCILKSSMVYVHYVIGNQLHWHGCDWMGVVRWGVASPGTKVWLASLGT